MQISNYNPTKNTADEFRQLLRKKYGNLKNFDYYLDDFDKAWDFCTDNKNVSFYPISGYVNGLLEAHAALIIDKRLSAREAFFGFLEFPNDATAFSSLWTALVKEARDKDVSLLKGPVNGSIWHQYRCIKDGGTSPFFKTEPFCEMYYYDFLVSNKPTTEILYHSASREPFTIVLRMIDKNALDKMKSFGFSIREAKQVTIDEMHKIATISRVVFSNNWGYTELNESEFFRLYSSDKLGVHLASLYLLYKDGEIVGFCSTSKEDDTTLICKTIGVLPQYHGMGLGNALAYKVHHDAEVAGFKKIIYALIREGNSITNFPKEGVTIFRRYAAFEFQV
jgi:N-acetylglutamate synthase-like GNAT family acetyltransferase